MPDTHQQHQPRDLAGRAIHQNSLEAMGRHDPRIADAIRRGRKKAWDDEQAMKSWARQGFGPSVRVDAESSGYPERSRNNGRFAAEGV